MAITFFAMSGTVSCHRNAAGSVDARTAAMAMVLDDADAPQTALYWVRNSSDGYETLLINGNKNHTVALASIPSLVISTGTTVFELSSPVEEVMLCDCAQWQGADSECPPSLESASRQRLLLSTPGATEAPEMVDLFPLDVAEDGVDRLVSLTEKAVVTGTVGPYVFTSYERTYQLCGDEAVTETHGYRVFNLESMQFDSVLTDAELASVNDKERQDAYESIGSATGFRHVAADELVLTQIRPVYVYGLGFSLEYQFEAQSQMDTMENNWRDYTRQVSVQAREIPAALKPYALAPSLVRNLVPAENVSVGGWMIVSGTPEANVALLEKLFQVERDNRIDGKPIAAAPQE